MAHKKEKKRTGRLPAAVVGLWLMVHRLKNPKPKDHHLLTPEEVPAEVEKVASAVERAVRPPKQGDDKPYRPKVRLNRSLAALHREHPNLFRQVHRWLLQTRVLEQFAQKGHSAIWNRWVEGSAQIQEGKRPNQALGTRRKVVKGKIKTIMSGRPPETGFSNYHDAAICAEYLSQVQRVPSERAAEQAIKLVGQTLGGFQELNRREVQRWRKRVRSIKPSKVDLQDQYALIKRKLELRLKLLPRLC